MEYAEPLKRGLGARPHHTHIRKRGESSVSSHPYPSPTSGHDASYSSAGMSLPLPAREKKEKKVVQIIIKEKV